MTGTPPGAVLGYDPAGDKWTKKEEHAAARRITSRWPRTPGKIYVLRRRRARRQAGGPSYVPVQQRVGIRPGGRRVEGAGGDADEPPRGGRSRGRRKIYVMGGAGNYKEPRRPVARAEPARIACSTSTRCYDPGDQYVGGEDRSCRRRADSMFAGVVNGKIYLIGGRVATAFATTGSVDRHRRGVRSGDR